MEFAQSKKKRKPLPGYAIFIIVFGSISLIVGIARGILEAQTEQTVKQYQDLMSGGSSTSSSSTTSVIGVTPVSYKGISIKIPKGWTSETTDQEGGLVHQISLESPDVDGANISWARGNAFLPPREWVQTMHDTGGEDFNGFSPEEITECTYCGEQAYQFIFSMKQLGFTYYSKFLAFKKGGYTIGIFTMSDLRSNLSKKFSFIEDTLTIE